MPIYQFACTDENCDGAAEAFVPHEKEPSECPKCGKPLKRVIGTTAFALKGGGWFKDGYSKKGQP
jgi:putative FmdB family regulatory protein